MRPRTTPIERIALAAALGGVLYAVINLVLFPHWAVDDAYSYLRYAQNFAHHGSLVWNFGHARVEGYTGVGLPTLEALGIAVGLSGTSIAHALGIAALFGTAGAMAWSLWLLRCHTATIAAAVVLFCATPIAFTHATSGLETMLFEFALTLSFGCLVNVLSTTEHPKRADTTLLLALLATSLVRPDGVAISVVFVCAVALARRASHTASAFLVRALVVYVLPGAAYFIWRVAYYGHLLPNTYYSKRSGFTLSAAHDLASFLATYFGALVVALIVVAAISLRRPRSGRETAVALVRTRAISAAAALVACAIVGVAYLRTNLENNYSHRFFAPMGALLLVVLAIAFEHLRGRRADHPRAIRLAVTGLVLGAVAVQVGLQVARLGAERRFAADYAKLLKQEDIAVGKRLRALPPSAWIATYQAGAVPYFAAHPAVDMLGLNDVQITHRSLTGSAEADYLFRFSPAALVLLKDRPLTSAVLSDPRMRSYVLGGAYTTTAGSYRGEVTLLYLKRPPATQGRAALR